MLQVDDAELTGGDWDEILRNPRINRVFRSSRSTCRHQIDRMEGRLLPSHLSALISSMVSNNLAVYEPSKQTRSVLLFWRQPEEWAEVLHAWVGTIDGASFSDAHFGPGLVFGTNEYDPHFLRHYRAACAITTVWHSNNTSSQGNQYPCQVWPCSDDCHCRWRRREIPLGD